MQNIFFSLRLLLTKFKSKDDKVVEEIHWKHMNKWEHKAQILIYVVYYASHLANEKIQFSQLLRSFMARTAHETQVKDAHDTILGEESAYIHK